jgi:hypothetical protein
MVAVVRQRLPHAPRSTHHGAVYSENLDAAKGRGTGGGQEKHRLRPVYTSIAGQASSLRHLEAATQFAARWDDIAGRYYARYSTCT